MIRHYRNKFLVDVFRYQAILWEHVMRSRIEAAGYTDVSKLDKDKDGVWRGKASKSGTSSDVSLDYQGNVSPK
jgi:hypothetical protein